MGESRSRKNRPHRRSKRGREKTPNWLLERYPVLNETIPRPVLVGINNGITNWTNPESRPELGEMIINVYREAINEGKAPEDIEGAAINSYMNNFSIKVAKLLKIPVLKLDQKFASGDANSERFRTRTKGEFLEDIKHAVQECGLSLDEAMKLGIGGDRMYGSNIYLFPAFVKLIRLGYNDHPDLIA